MHNLGTHPKFLLLMNSKLKLKTRKCRLCSTSKSMYSRIFRLSYNIFRDKFVCKDVKIYIWIYNSTPSLSRFFSFWLNSPVRCKGTVQTKQNPLAPRGLSKKKNALSARRCVLICTNSATEHHSFNDMAGKNSRSVFGAKVTSYALLSLISSLGF